MNTIGSVEISKTLNIIGTLNSFFFFLCGGDEGACEPCPT